MTSDSKEDFSYPPHIVFINKILKKYVNLYWTIVDLFSNKFPAISHFFYESKIKQEYDKEHNILNLKDSDVILHLGCGVYPYSAFVLSEKKNKKIVTIDNKHDVIRHAQKMIQKKHLNQKITVEKGDAATYDISPFSVIISSSCVDLSKGFIKHIVNDAKSGTRIIVREFRPMSLYLKDYLLHQENIILEKQFINFSFPFHHLLIWDSFILRKK